MMVTLAVAATAPFMVASERAVDARAAVAFNTGEGLVAVEAPAPAEPGDTGAVTPTTAVCVDGQEPGDYIGEVQDWGRTYRIHIPASSRGVRAPLVLNFHGSGRTAAEQEEYSGLLPLADHDGSIVVSPEGSGSPSGWDIPDVYHEIGVDDVGFVRDLVAQLTTTTCIDQSRVYATGHSNGAQMASQVACLLPDLFAAVAPVSGVEYQGCDGEPVPLIAFHGTADENIAYDWPASAAGEWAIHNGCTSSLDETVSQHVAERVYSGCTGDVVFYIIDDGGHTWPGAEDNAGGVGFTTHEISASEIIWQFFAAHPKT